MTKENAIIQSKQFRVDADELLQRMKDHRKALLNAPPTEEKMCEDFNEVIAQHTLSIRDLESCIMRQGMTLKYIGNPTPYPNSYDASNTKVDPTADGLKL